MYREDQLKTLLLLHVLFDVQSFDVRSFSMFSLSRFGPPEVRSFDVQSFDVRSLSRFGLSMFGPIRGSVLRCSGLFDIRSFEFWSFDVQSFEVRSFDVRSFEVRSRFPVDTATWSYSSRNLYELCCIINMKPQ